MIRLATEADIPAINILRKQVNELHVEGRPDVFKPGFTEDMQDQARIFLSNPDRKIFVSENDGKITGMVMIDYVAKPESAYSYGDNYSHVKEICVDAAWRRRGIAHDLMEAVKVDARSQGMRRIELGVWAFNDASAFYEKEGFLEARRYLEYKL